MARSALAFAVLALAPATAFTPDHRPTMAYTQRRASVVRSATFPPDNFHREGARIIGSLKANAALLSAFSFAALTKADLPDAANPRLSDAYVILVCLTLALELVAVFVGQEMLYAMADGSFGATREDGTEDPERTILSIMLLNYRQKFYTVRVSFLAGGATMLSAIAVRAWACYDPPIATFVTAIFLIAAVLIGASNRETAQSFERVRLLDTAPLSLRESFEEADADGNGRLDSREVANALRRCNVALSADSLAALVARCSPSEGMTLDFAGFVRLVALVKQEGLTSNSGASDDICAVGERQE